MKKFLGILVLLIIVAAGVCAYLFPGTPYYYKCTHELELTENIWEGTPTDIKPLPEDYKNYDGFGVRITAWGDMKLRPTGDEKSSVWSNEDNSHLICITQERISENEDFLDMTGINHDDLNAYCMDTEKTTPENKYEFVKLMASLTMDDFDIHNYKNSKTFYKIMKKKNEDFCDDAGKPLRLCPVDGVGFRGFLMTAKSPDKNAHAVINIYPEKDKRTRYIIDLSVTSPDEVIAVAESIKLT